MADSFVHGGGIAAVGHAVFATLVSQWHIPVATAARLQAAVQVELERDPYLPTLFIETVAEADGRRNSRVTREQTSSAVIWLPIARWRRIWRTEYRAAARGDRSTDTIQ